MKLLIGLCLLTSMSSALADDPTTKPLAIGDAAIDFDLPGVDDKRYSLKSFANANFLAIVFTCNHCPTAQAYEARLKKLVTDYKDRGVAFVAISPNDPESVRLDELGYSDLNDSLEDMKLRSKHAKFNFPYLYDGATQKTSRAYGAKATPQIILLDKARKIRYSGAIDDKESGKGITEHYARDALDALLAKKPLAKTRTRVFGCSIKWKSKRGENQKYLEKLAKEKVQTKDLDLAALKKLRKNKGEKYLLVNVWATWCGPCVIELPELVEIYRMYRGRDLDFATISIDKPFTRKRVLPLLEKVEASNTNYVFTGDSLNDLADTLDATWSGTLPFTVLIAPDGKVVYRHEEKIDALELRREIVNRLGRTYE